MGRVAKPFVPKVLPRIFAELRKVRVVGGCRVISRTSEVQRMIGDDLHGKHPKEGYDLKVSSARQAGRAS